MLIAVLELFAAVAELLIVGWLFHQFRLLRGKIRQLRHAVRDADEVLRKWEQRAAEDQPGRHAASPPNDHGPYTAPVPALNGHRWPRPGE